MFEPSKLSDCYNKRELLDRLQIRIDKKYIENTIFIGDYNTCKTTLIKIFINDFYKQNYPDINIDKYTQYYNLSIENSNFDIIKSIDNFNLYCNISNIHKIIVLDDFDLISKDKQHKINSYISNNNDLIFFIICQDINKITTNLISTFNKEDIQSLKFNEYLEYMKNVVKITICSSILKHLYIITKNNINKILKYIDLYYNLINNKRNIEYDYIVNKHCNCSKCETLYDNGNNQIIDSYDSFLHVFNFKFNIADIGQFINLCINCSDFDIIKNKLKEYDNIQDIQYSDIINYSCDYIEDLKIDIDKKTQILTLLKKENIEMKLDHESYVYFVKIILKLFNFINKQ